MSIVYEHVSEDGNERFHVDLGDNRHLLVNVTHEGIVMDVYNYIDGWEDSRDMGLEGTVAMMFDEWAAWIGADTV